MAVYIENWDSDESILVCTECHAREPFRLPRRIDDASRALGDFVECHRDCARVVVVPEPHTHRNECYCCAACFLEGAEGAHIRIMELFSLALRGEPMPGHIAEPRLRALLDRARKLAAKL